MRYSFKTSFRFVFLLILLISFCINGCFSIYAQPENLKNNKVYHVLLEQSYPLCSKEELVNCYAQPYLQKTFHLNDYPSFNSNNDSYLNTKIKDAPSNLLGVWFDEGTRQNKDNEFRMDDLINLSNNDDNVKRVYFFYDNTDYCDVSVNLKFDKNIYFPTNNKDWVVPDEWRGWFTSYQEWRDRWYNKKTPTVKGYTLNKYNEQGFKLAIHVDEKDTVYNVPLHAVVAVYENNNNFYSVKNFAFKNYLGDGIEVDYNQPKLTFQTNNSGGAFWRKTYDLAGYVPVVGAVRGIYELSEGAIQENNEQIVEGGVDVALEVFTFGVGKLIKAPTKAVGKAVVKGAAKSVVKNTAKKQLSKVVIKKLETLAIKTTIHIIGTLQNFVNPNTVITLLLNDFLKKEFTSNQPVKIDLGDNQNLTVIPKEKNNYDFKNNEKVIVINHEGKTTEFVVGEKS